MHACMCVTESEKNKQENAFKFDLFAIYNTFFSPQPAFECVVYSLTADELLLPSRNLKVQLNLPIKT